MEARHNALWQTVLGEIEISVSQAAFATWFKNTELSDVSGNELTISVPNIFIKAQLEKKFDDQIKDTLRKNGIDNPALVYAIKSSGKKTQVNREITSASVAELAPSSSSPTVSLSGRQTPTTNLNPRYTFDNFIVGSSNDLAYTACQAVASKPGTKYNPLFLYGGAGLGKTHLMQAVGNEIMRTRPKTRILYTTTETFVQEFLSSIRFKKKGFSDKYRNVDVLIVDDMQFIANKEKTQEEFFHTFNDLHQNNKQIIISSDKPPKSIPTLTERLRSRFEWGMAIDIQMPDFETRCAIIEAKAALSGMTLTSEVIEYLASNVKTNIRELEGALNQLLAYSEMRGITPDIATAEGLIGSVRQTRPQHLSPKQIIDRTARHFQLDAKEICSAKRDKHIVVPRQIAMYLLRSELHLSFPKIAQELGRKDHTTAIHSVEKIDKAVKLDLTIRESINDIRGALYA